MKFLLISFLLLCSSLSFSFPNEGDFVRYQAQQGSDTYEIKKGLIEYDPFTDSYLETYKLTLNEEILDEYVIAVQSWWLYNPTKVLDLLRTCVRREGALERMKIANSFVDVCTFHNESAQLDYSIGMVPFGQVRFQHYLGGSQFLDFYLVDFQMGPRPVDVE